ncbi:MAG: hypothetical protein KDJ27_15455 [Gammaproteobacteria bacterium]|nr:hypothetical protein [Gammaproteobacteria bacterium]MCB1925114.1 hypothetical protein [Gammaproteobacteria bacterium]
MSRRHPIIIALVAVSALAPALAAPVDGDLGSQAAGLLMLLGVAALLLGMRNLRELRNKRPVRPRRPRDTANESE